MKPRLTTDQLFALQNAVAQTIEQHKRLHWEICSLFGDARGERDAGIKMLQKLAAEDKLLESAMATVCRMFENQFEESGE